MNDTIKPMIYSIADALEMDLTVAQDFKLNGTKKTMMELFEGYSPTVISDVTDSLIDTRSNMVCVVVRIWGNLSVLVVNDKRASTISLFVFDKSKAPKEAPFGSFWSRKQVYQWLEPCVQAVYWRSVYDTVWAELPHGRNRIAKYNTARKSGKGSDDAYNEFWHTD